MVVKDSRGVELHRDDVVNVPCRVVQVYTDEAGGTLALRTLAPPKDGMNYGVSFMCSPRIVAVVEDTASF